MKFGIFTELQCQGKSEYQTYWELLAQAEQADGLGYESFWLAELHFSRAFSILAAPLTVHAALAQRTRTIRLGVAVCTLPLWQPVRLASEAAVVDILSDGRLNVGVGRGHPWMFDGFGISPEESRDRFHECLEILVRAWTKESFSYDGKFLNLRDINVVPKPAQKPHPPVYMAGVTEASYEGAARLGLKLMLPSTMVASFPSLSDGLSSYARVWRETGRNPDEVVAVVSAPVYVAETEAAALAESREYIMNFYKAVLDTVAPFLARYRTVPKSYEIYGHIIDLLEKLTHDSVLQDHVLFGDPDTVVDKLRRLEKMVGFTQLNAIFNFGGIPHNLVTKSQKLFAEYVIPNFKESPNR